MKRPEVEGGVVVGNTYDKYGTRNPLARMMVRSFLGTFDALVKRAGASSVLEVGCGEGELSLRMARTGLKVRGTDISGRMIEVATSRAEAEALPIRFEVSDILASTPRGPAPDLVVCCEVLEHLPDPELALLNLKRTGARMYLLSVPREPLWRILNVARGRYLGDLGNTPGHLQHWSRRRFLQFVSEHLTVTEVHTPFPWTMVLARAPASGTRS